MSTSCITSRLTLGSIASGALSELALNYNLRAEIIASSAYGNGRFVGIPTTERSSLRLFEGNGFQLKRTVGKIQIDLRSAAQCVLDSLTTSRAPEDLVKKLGDTLKVIDYVRDGDVITVTKIRNGITAEEAAIDAHNIALTLENALFLTVEDTTVWGQVMPSAAFEVLGKQEECPKPEDKCPEGKTCLTKKELEAKEEAARKAQAGVDAMDKTNAVRQAHNDGVEKGKKQGGGETEGYTASEVGLLAGTATVVVTAGIGWIIHRRMAQAVAVRPKPGAVTVDQGTDGKQLFTVWEPADDQGQHWRLRAQPYSEEQVVTLFTGSGLAISKITKNGTIADNKVLNPKDQIKLRVARGYVAQFTQFTQFCPQANANQGTAAATAAPT